MRISIFSDFDVDIMRCELATTCPIGRDSAARYQKRAARQWSLCEARESANAAARGVGAWNRDCCVSFAQSEQFALQVLSGSSGGATVGASVVDLRRRVAPFPSSPTGDDTAFSVMIEEL